MMAIKQIICSDRLRRVPAQFSWIDHRLVRDHHIDRCDAHAAMLYLFLVTVADARGVSWYSDESTARRLSMNMERLCRARSDLIQTGLIAWASPVYQVLALDRPPIIATPVAIAPTTPTASHPIVDKDKLRERLANLHAAIGERP
jgi:hypothetical protein